MPPRPLPAPLLVAALAVACGGDPAPTAPRPTASLTIAPDTIRVGMLERPYELAAWAAHDSTGARAVVPEVRTLDARIATAERFGPSARLVGHANGATRVVATYTVPNGGPTLVDTAVVVVRQVVAGVTIVPARFRLGIGDTVTFAAVAHDSGRTRVADAAATWRSSAPAVAAVGPDGRATTAALGDATVLATVPDFAGGTVAADAPLRVTATGGIASVHSGGQLTCLLTEAGEPWCWGDEGIATGGLDARDAVGDMPRRVAGTPPLVALDLGGFHVCGLTAQGVAHCWGGNLFGQLGMGDRHQMPVPTPRAVPGLVFRAIATGTTHTCGLTPEGAAYCWGSNDYGESGRPGSIVGEVVAAPQRVPGGHVFTEISAGSRSACALDTAGRAHCWGTNHGYQLGTDEISAGAGSATPLAVAGGLAFRTVRVVGGQTCAIAGASAVHCWGGWLRSLGNGNWLNLVGPTPVDDALGIVALGDGHGESDAVSGPLCGITAAGGAHCWPLNGQPSAVGVPGVVVSLSSGRDRKCAVTDRGWVYCWGSGNVGGIGTGRSGGSTTPVRIAVPF